MALKQLNKDVLTNVVSFLSDYEQERMTFMFPEIASMFEPIKSKRPPTNTLKPNWFQSQDDIKFVCKEYERHNNTILNESIVKNLIFGLHNTSRSIKTHFMLRDIETDKNVYRDFLTHFRHIEHLNFPGKISYDTRHQLLCMVQCMPKLKTLTTTIPFRNTEIRIEKHPILRDPDSIFILAPNEVHTHYGRMYAPLQLREKLETLIMNGKLSNDIIGNMIEIVQHLDRFDFCNVKVWFKLTGMRAFRPVYDAIVNKVKNGNTVHRCKHKEGFDILDYEIIDLCKTAEGIDLIAKMFEDGIMFDVMNNNAYDHGKEHLSYVNIRYLLENGVHILTYALLRDYFDCNDKFINESDRKMFLDRSCEFTVSRLDHSNVMESLMSFPFSWSEFFAHAFSLGFIDCHKHIIIRSLKKNIAEWTKVIDSLFASCDMYHLQWLINLCNPLEKRVIEITKEIDVGTIRNRMFLLWLRSQGYITLKLNHHDAHFVRPAKRSASETACFETIDEPPNKKIKS
jgi:hypothetical protein